MTSPLITQDFRAPGINEEDLTKLFPLFKYSYRNITNRKHEAKYMDIKEILNQTRNFVLKLKKKGNVNSVRRKLHYKANPATY